MPKTRFFLVHNRRAALLNWFFDSFAIDKFYTYDQGGWPLIESGWMLECYRRNPGYDFASMDADDVTLIWRVYRILVNMNRWLDEERSRRIYCLSQGKSFESCYPSSCGHPDSFLLYRISFCGGKTDDLVHPRVVPYGLGRMIKGGYPCPKGGRKVYDKYEYSTGFNWEYVGTPKEKKEEEQKEFQEEEEQKEEFQEEVVRHVLEPTGTLLVDDY